MEQAETSSSAIDLSRWKGAERACADLVELAKTMPPDDVLDQDDLPLDWSEERVRGFLEGLSRIDCSGPAAGTRIIVGIENGLDWFRKAHDGDGNDELWRLWRRSISLESQFDTPVPYLVTGAKLTFSSSAGSLFKGSDEVATIHRFGFTLSLLVLARIPVGDIWTIETGVAGGPYVGSGIVELTDRGRERLGKPCSALDGKSLLEIQPSEITDTLRCTFGNSLPIQGGLVFEVTVCSVLYGFLALHLNYAYADGGSLAGSPLPEDLHSVSFRLGFVSD